MIDVDEHRGLEVVSPASRDCAARRLVLSRPWRGRFGDLRFDFIQLRFGGHAADVDLIVARSLADGAHSRDDLVDEGWSYTGAST